MATKPPVNSPYPATIGNAPVAPTIGSSPTGAISQLSGAPTVGGPGAAYAMGMGSVANSQIPTQAYQPPTGIETGGVPGGGLKDSSLPGGSSTSNASPSDMLAELLGGAPQFNPAADTTDYMAQAKAIYDPQTDYLAGLDAAARANAAKSGKSLDEMYAELARQIAGQATGINQNYNTALGNVGQYGNEAMAAIKGSFDNTRNGVADTLARLGIQEAAPNTVGQNTEMQQLMQGILSANSQATKNQLVEGRQSTLDFNQANVTGAKLQGGEAKEGLAKQLQGFLQELGLKKADLQSQIQQWAMQAQGKAQDTAYQRYRDQVGDWQWGQNFGATQADKAADNALAELKAAQESAANAGDKTKLDPIGSVQALASRAYPNKQAADNAVNAVTTSLALLGKNSNEPVTLERLYAMLEKRFGGKSNDLPQLRQLAAELMKQSYGT